MVDILIKLGDIFYDIVLGVIFFIPIIIWGISLMNDCLSGKDKN
ncbi:MAG: hypothetical protein WC140_01180 [Bacteroidales bacterium]